MWDLLGGRERWPSSATSWLLALLAVGLGLGLALTLAWFVHARWSAGSAPTHGMAAALDEFDVTLGFVIALNVIWTVGTSFLVALPLQATALNIRRARTGGGVFAAVAGLTVLSTLLTFLVLFVLQQPLFELIGASGETIRTMLIAIYVTHVVVLLVARAIARRKDLPAAADVPAQ